MNHAMAKVATLSLAPEFGGQVFGPFPAGTVLLGSDQSQCALALHPSLGIRPVHAQLIVVPDGGVILQPVDTAGPVFAHPAGRRPERLRGATRLAPGDAFSLATADGVRFTVGIQEAAPVAAAARPQGMGRLSTASLGREAVRQVDVALQTAGPVAGARKLGFQWKSGALFQPRNVVALVIALGGAMIVGCGGLATAIFAWLRHGG